MLQKVEGKIKEGALSKFRHQLHRRNSLARARRAGISVLLLCLAACSALPDQTAESGLITEEMLLAGAPFLKHSPENLDAASSEPLPALPQKDLLAMTPAMKSFVDYYVDKDSSNSERLRQLMSAIVHSRDFSLNTTSNTFTAAETFRYGHGNCLSFTNMFIAMARHVGLDAKYQEVDIPPTWNEESGTLVLSRHINIFVKTPARSRSGQAAADVLDFGTTDIKPHYDTKRVSDKRALAHYYSNLGVDALQEGDYQRSFLLLREGLRADASMDALWNNLGIVYARIDRLDYAEKALHIAASKSSDMSGLSNLARLYERLGDEERAALYREKVAHYRSQNPYYRYYLAETLIDQGEYIEAAKHLDAAIRLKPAEDAFYFLMGVAHLRQGDRARARSWFNEARDLSHDASTRYRYNSKMQRLLADTNAQQVDA